MWPPLQDPESPMSSRHLRGWNMLPRPPSCKAPVLTRVKGPEKRTAEAGVSPLVLECDPGLLLLFQTRHLQIYMGHINAVNP